MIDLFSLKYLHFIGLGGIGMSALARIFNEQGKKISGSDKEDSTLLSELANENIKINLKHSPENIPENCQAVIITEAIPAENTELLEAKHRQLPILTCFQALGLLTEHYFTIAICGTHGKTTTTAMTALALIAGGLDPTVVIGTKVKEFGHKNMRIGQSQYLVVEACEYRRSFLHLQPNMIVMNNIEAEHLDYYKDLEDYRVAFLEFAAKLPGDGMLVANGDDDEVSKVSRLSKVSKACPPKFEERRRVVSFGQKKVNYDYVLNGEKIINNNSWQGSLKLKVPGQHNKLNALAAFAVGRQLGIPASVIIEALNKFQGTWRRFEFKGTKNNVDVYDDYGHHPTEIAATLQGAREKFGSRRIILVFQPHQYSRTIKLLPQFTKAFHNADIVIIPNIYQVRDNEADLIAMNPQKLVAAISAHHPNVHFGQGFKTTLKMLNQILKPNDVLLTMGAGDVWKVGEKCLRLILI